MMVRLTGRRRKRLSYPGSDAPGRAAAPRPNKRRSTVSRKKPQPFCGLNGWPDESEVFIALARAWMVATIATAFLCVALAIAPVWDRSIYMDGLRDALSRDPQLTQPPDGTGTDNLHPPLPGPSAFHPAYGGT